MPFISPEYFTYFLTALMVVVIFTDIWRYYIPDTVNILMFLGFLYYVIQKYPDKTGLILLLYVGIAFFIFIAIYFFDDDKREIKPLYEALFYVFIILYFIMLYRYNNADVIWQPFFVMLGLFVVGIVLALLGQMAGGDIKLISLCGLWIGYNTELLTIFLLVMSFTGLLLILLLLAIRLITKRLIKKGKTASFIKLLPQSFYKKTEERHQVPYGFAIALAFIAVVWQPTWLFNALLLLLPSFNFVPQTFF